MQINRSRSEKGKEGERGGEQNKASHPPPPPPPNTHTHTVQTIRRLVTYSDCFTTDKSRVKQLRNSVSDHHSSSSIIIIAVVAILVVFVVTVTTIIHHHCNHYQHSSTLSLSKPSTSGSSSPSAYLLWLTIGR